MKNNDLLAYIFIKTLGRGDNALMTSSIYDFGLLLRTMRSDRSLTQVELAVIAGISLKPLGNYEKQSRFKGNPRHLEQLLAGLHGSRPITAIEASAFLNDTESPLLRSILNDTSPAVEISASPSDRPTPAQIQRELAHKMLDAMMAFATPAAAVSMLSTIIERFGKDEAVSVELAPPSENSASETESEISGLAMAGVHYPPVEIDGKQWAVRVYSRREQGDDSGARTTSQQSSN